MADSDLYQHLLSTESIHNISPFKSNYFYLSNNVNNGSLTSSATSSTTASSTSISSLSNTSNISNDEDDIKIKDINWSIEGGLQRALVINFDNNDNEYKNDYRMTDKYASLYNDDDEESKPPTTFSFESWMNSYKNQPQQIVNRINRSSTSSIIISHFVI